ncbi:MAG: Xaa-Pro peptidase family protein [Chloroflexota bacterium]
METIQPWFARAEYVERVERVQVALREQGLVALLAFQPESVTYLTGFFTRGYESFQFTIVPAKGEPVLVCRDMEGYYVEKTAVFSNHLFWNDSDDKTAVAVRAITQSIGKKGKCGIELDSWQLNASRFMALQAALPNLSFVDCSTMVATMRIIKSPAEIDYQRRAGKAAEAGMTAAIKTAVPGNTEREVAAEICAAMIRAGSDRPGPGVLSTGERAFHLHGGYTDRVIEVGDPVQIETTPNVCYYHARFMRPIKAGRASERDQEIVAKLIAIQDRALDSVGPAIAATAPDSIYRQGVLQAGLAASYTNKTFYSIGLILDPNSGEPLEATPTSTWTFVPGMVFHTYVLAQGFGMSETIAITKTGFERLTNYPRQLFVT